MNERLKVIRKGTHLNQEEFGKILGVTKASISRLESGINKLTDRMIISICREFNINEDWFRYGDGNMYSSMTENEQDIKNIISKIYSGNDTSRIAILNTVATIIHDDYCWNIIEKQLLQVIQQTSIDKSLASYRNELEAESKALEKSEVSLLPKEKNA